MLKKASIVTIGLAVAIAPGVAAAEENNENQNQQTIVEAEVETTENGVESAELTTDQNEEDTVVENEDGNSTEENSSGEELVEDETNDSEQTDSATDEQSDNQENTDEVPVENDQSQEEVAQDDEAGQDDGQAVPVDEDEEKVEDENDEQPELTVEDIVAQMKAFVSGGVSEYDKEKGYYTLELKASVTNNSSQEISDIYTSFDIPSDIMVLDTAETPENFELLNVGDKTAIALPVGKIGAGETKDISLNIPVIGKTSVQEVSPTITAVYISQGGYAPIGEISGSSSIDYTSMNQTTYFEGRAQAVVDHPGLEKNQFAMQFGFKLHNLTTENIDNVKIEYIVPNGVTIQKPDGYKEGEVPDGLDGFLDGGIDLGLGSSSMDIEWNGNTATVDIGLLERANGYQGFFSAFGKSELGFNQLTGLKVKISLYSGNEEIDSFTTPIELVKYQGNDKPEDDNTEDDKEQNNGGVKPVVNKPVTDSTKDDQEKGQNKGNDKQSSEKPDEDVTVTPVDGDSDDEQGGKLPKTAGTNPVGALMGGVIAAFGAAVLAVRKKLFQ
ncbi:hypothetical protein [Metabacillus malikii]|uniref:Gram-positive cocci surface proteins LPxTG domain-containing protein n=1 Tax=Metabacillus malikii TaxID=1504265 RepID=A0ABT9ZJV3_9BACI|nr:hypothetical protein [Metabacillus malikii]MDQ0232569.1 hypothetical protein [Metabacillus malikii]